MNKEPMECEHKYHPTGNSLQCYICGKNYLSTQEPMEWESGLELVSGYKYASPQSQIDIKKYITFVIKQAEERERKRICGILRQIGTIEGDEQMEKVIKIINQNNE